MASAAIARGRTLLPPVQTGPLVTDNCPWRASPFLHLLPRKDSIQTEGGATLAYNHTHDIEHVVWPDQRGHFHAYQTPTTVNMRHRHFVRGTTSGPYPGGASHVHYYEGVTTFDDGHTHRFRGWTGPAIPLPGGGHFHLFEGRTSFNDGHDHGYRGRTGINRR